MSAPRGGVETPVMATAAGGTHPTGMHSFFFGKYGKYWIRPCKDFGANHNFSECACVNLV